MTNLTTKLSRSLARAEVRRQINQATSSGAVYDHIYLQTWLIIATICVFAAYVAYQQGLFAIMISTDQSYLSLLIFLVFLGASAHAAWHIFATSSRIKQAGRLLDGASEASFKPAPVPQSIRLITRLSDAPTQFVGNFVRDIKESVDHARKAGRQELPNHVLEIYADQLRSPVEIGWYIVDILIRLGLIGTIVGFILILRSLVGGPLPSADEIQSLLVSMSGGMGTALFTTLAGLTAATLLGVQYMVLGRSVETLIAALVRINERTNN